MPIGWKSAYENDEVLTFYGLSASPVYMVAGYGDYSLMGPPPSGTPVAMYRHGEQAPTPIELNEDVVEVHFTFDDSNRIP